MQQSSLSLPTDGTESMHRTDALLLLPCPHNLPSARSLDSGLKYSQECIVLAGVQLRVLIVISIAPDQIGGCTLQSTDVGCTILKPLSTVGCREGSSEEGGGLWTHILV